ncbi:probable polyamine transporter At3g13620 [Cryptomeria japonica]|uniref:probable polyamine transporter At3g13620 n=1 Tax=Cryptomeria japonica TaxID=3369 RepID=UPI0025AB6468|nr:probable polyamine transporter At3g13620 [Cryptomeria japonica]
MGQSSQTLGGGDEEDLNTTTNGPQAEATESKSKKLKLVPLIFLIYFEVSGGPFGEEPAVKAAGPLLALLGFIIFPFIWSIPEALVTAELATAYPGNGGYVVWAWAAFGPFWGFLMGWWKWISGVINNAAYPVLCVDYLKILFAAFNGGPVRSVAILLYTIALSYLNFTGLSIVGWTAVTLGLVSLAPFVLMFFFSIPKLKPSRWGVLPQGDMDWSLYFNTLFWNLNFWDNASTLAGEVDNPQRTFPRALLCAGLLTCVGYILPLLAGTGALELNRDLWTDGYLAEAAGLIAGSWLKYWIELGAVLSTVGLFEAQLSSASFQLLGMAEIGLLPSAMAKRSSYNTPFLGILFSAGGTLLLSYLSFTTIISAANFLYSCGMLLEFASFLWLRRKFPALKRPYRVPTGIPGLLCMCAVPVAFLIFVMTLADSAVYVLSISVTVAGILGYFLMKTCKKRNWIDFADGIGESENRNDAQSVYEGLLHSQ